MLLLIVTTPYVKLISIYKDAFYFITGIWKHTINLSMYGFMSIALLIMQCSVEWEKYQLRKSQTLIFQINSIGNSVKRTGMATLLIVFVISSHLFWIFLFPNDSKMTDYYFLKVLYIKIKFKRLK